MLSKSAFNALLKTLEEPPRHVIFIMATTDAYKVPITITSRAQVYNFQLASPDVMLKHLKSIAKSEKIKITDDALEIVVARGGGSFRDSISLLDQLSALSADNQTELTKEAVISALGLPEDSLCLDLLTAYESGDTQKITDSIKTILNSGTKPEILAENLIKKIIDNPKPELLPLLAKLPDVKSPFAEARLLLAFLGEGTATAKPAPRPILTPKPAPAPAPKSKPAPARPSSFDWNTFCENIKDINLGIYTTLKKCAYSFENNHLQIITERKIHKTILSSTSNLKVLQKFLPAGVDVEIGNGTELAANDKKLGQISDIMGNVTEVKSDGVPF